MEFASKGDLQKQISERSKRRDFYDEKTIWKYAADMLKGLKVLHNSKILHRDLKCANIFISNNDSLKLGDLNVSKVQKRDFAYTQTGTPYYAAPEVWKNRPYDGKCDIWSFGCVLYEITTFDPPFKGFSMEDLYKKILRGVFQPINTQRYSIELQQFISSCLKVEPKQRECLDNLLLHKNISPFVAQEDPLGKDQNLLQTIKLPLGGNLKGLNIKLPKAMYEQIEEEYKSEQIKQKKQVQSRPNSALPKPTGDNKEIQQQNVKAQDVKQQMAQENSESERRNRQLSAQPQNNQRMQRIQSYDDCNRKHYMPPINQKQQVVQPIISVHQQNDNIFNRYYQRQRQNSKEVVQQRHRSISQSKNNQNENNKNIGNIKQQNTPNQLQNKNPNIQLPPKPKGKLY